MQSNLTGQQLGPYILHRQLGEGGMATVYRASHTVMGWDVALKVLNPSLTGDADFVERFTREARLLDQMQHPNIVKVRDAAWQSGYFYIAMEYLDGESLDVTLERVGRLGPAQAVHIGGQVADALSYAHTHFHLVHRDIKPGNVFLLRDGSVKVLDFGVVAILSGKRSATTQIGTPEYMPYEQMKGQADARSDVYALGASLYQMLTSQLPPPFGIEPPALPRQLNSQVSPALEQVILRALQRDPAARFQSAAEFGSALQATVLAQRGSVPSSGAVTRIKTPQPPVSPVRPPSPRSPLVPAGAARSMGGRLTPLLPLVVMVIVVVALVGGVALVVSGTVPPRTQTASPSPMPEGTKAAPRYCIVVLENYPDSMVYAFRNPNDAYTNKTIGPGTLLDDAYPDWVAARRNTPMVKVKYSGEDWWIVQDRLGILSEAQKCTPMPAKALASETPLPRPDAGKIEPVEPADGATFSPDKAPKYLKWSAYLAEGQKFRLTFDDATYELSKDNVTSLEGNQFGYVRPEWKLNELGAHTWRVEIVDREGKSTASGGPWTFTVQAPPTPVPPRPVNTPTVTPTPLPACQNGKEWNGAECVCPKGTVWDGQKQWCADSGGSSGGGPTPIR